MADGNTFRLDLPDQEKLGIADVRVSAKYPDGQDAATTDVPVAELGKTLTLTVDPAHPIVLADGGAAPTRRLRGKVVDEAGKVDVRNRQVILWGKQGDAELQPIVVEHTDAMGNFSTAWPDLVLDSAVATVEGSHNVSPAHGVPVALDPHVDAKGKPTAAPCRLSFTWWSWPNPPTASRATVAAMTRAHHASRTKRT